MIRDFTLASYMGIVEAALAAGYRTLPVIAWLDGERPDQPVAVLRHDVDRRPRNALLMARAEAALGVAATYYFRVVGSAHDPGIIREIAGLGHEVGYHYEDFHTARYDAARAHALFLDNLEGLRALAPIRSIAMHGSPLARHGNMELWKTHGFESAGVKDCILSADWSRFVFFTDTGRSFGARLTNLRDQIGGLSVPGVRGSADVARHLREVTPRHVQISTHPERWNDAPLPWLRQLGVDTAANTVKLGLRVLRPKG